MSEYESFRLIITPDLAVPGSWQVSVDECPVPGLLGPKGSVTPVLTKADLDTLRSRLGWPDAAKLKAIGQRAWTSVMTPGAEAAFVASIPHANGANKGLRLVVIVQGDDAGLGGAGAIRLSELPVEAFYTNTMQFVGTDLQTPISRSFQQKPDRDPQRIELPLRVLVAIAAPSDRPPAKTGDEVDVIKEAVKEHVGAGGMLEVDYVEQATRQNVAARLAEKPYSVLHFIGHGGFDIVGEVATPRAYLAFVRGDGTGLSEPTDSDTLSTMLRNTSVRLVVITACASAAPTPPLPNELDPGPLGTGAFDGVAQRLVTGIAPVNAAVGMQFDLETKGAVAFSKAFYENLLRPEIPIDEVVTLARKEIATALETGHRAWVTPAVYWRCRDGRVFDIDEALGKIDDKTLANIQKLETGIGINRSLVDKVLATTGAQRAALQAFLIGFLDDLDTQLADRGRLLGETVGITGGRGAPGGTVRARLALRMRRAGRIDSIRFAVEIPAPAAFVSAEAGAATGAAPAINAAGPAIQVVFVDPANGTIWKAGEHELGFLNISIPEGAQPALADLKVTAVDVRRSGKQAKVRGVDGVLFVEGGM